MFCSDEIIDDYKNSIHQEWNNQNIEVFFDYITKGSSKECNFCQSELGSQYLYDEYNWFSDISFIQRLKLGKYWLLESIKNGNYYAWYMLFKIYERWDWPSFDYNKYIELVSNSTKVKKDPLGFYELALHHYCIQEIDTSIFWIKQGLINDENDYECIYLYGYILNNCNYNVDNVSPLNLFDNHLSLFGPSIWDKELTYFELAKLYFNGIYTDKSIDKCIHYLRLANPDGDHFDVYDFTKKHLREFEKSHRENEQDYSAFFSSEFYSKYSSDELYEIAITHLDIYENSINVDLGLFLLEKSLESGCDKAGYELGDFYFCNGEYELAENTWLIAREINKNNGSIWFGLGILYSVQNKFEDSIDCLKNVLRCGPIDTMYYKACLELSKIYLKPNLHICSIEKSKKYLKLISFLDYEEPDILQFIAMNRESFSDENSLL